MLCNAGAGCAVPRSLCSAGLWLGEEGGEGGVQAARRSGWLLHEQREEEEEGASPAEHTLISRQTDRQTEGGREKRGVAGWGENSGPKELIGGGVPVLLLPAHGGGTVHPATSYVIAKAARSHITHGSLGAVAITELPWGDLARQIRD